MSQLGLTTVRGSGSSGHLQRNIAISQKRDNYYSINKKNYVSSPSKIVRRIDPAILAHEKKRKVEVKVMELREELEKRGVSESQIVEKINEFRQTLIRLPGNDNNNHTIINNSNNTSSNNVENMSRKNYSAVEINERNEHLKNALDIGNERKDKERKEKDKSKKSKSKSKSKSNNSYNSDNNTSTKQPVVDYASDED